MAYATFNKPSLHFNTKLYTGNGSTNAITGVGHQPDFTWIKRRDASGNHGLYDAVRGVLKRLQSDQNSAEATTADSLTAFGTDGFTMGSNSSYNGSGQTYASWNWKANGAGSANTDGTINTTVSVNTTAGFSIVKWTGTTSNGTIGHGLGATPSLFISKSMAGNHDWGVYHKSIGIGSSTLLNSSNASDTDATYYGGTSPTSTIMGLGTANATNASGNMIGYAFAEKKGYSKFATYTGNGNANGVFVYCGFKPAWIMIKCSSHSGDGWHIRDTKRSPINVVDDSLYANSNNAEVTNNTALTTDFLSNGFKLRNNDTNDNASGRAYIFMAFAEEPLVANVGASIPATAR